MAGASKPSVELREVAYSIIGTKGFNGLGYGDGLFDGIVDSNYTLHGWYYDLGGGSPQYIDLQVDEAFNLWRRGSPGSACDDYNGGLKAYKWNGSSYVFHSNVQGRSIDGAWTKCALNLPSGRWRFTDAYNDKGGYSYYIVDGEWFLEVANSDYILIKNGKNINDDIITLKSGNVVSLEKTQDQLISTDYINNGLLKTAITSSMLSGLSSKFDILIYSDGSIAPTNDKITGTSFNKLILAKGDIDLRSANCFNSATLNSTTTGSSVIKLIVSVDSGVTWKTFSAGSWNNINPTITDVNNSGITKTVLNAITKTQWELLLTSIPEKIRFGYLLNQSLSTESCNTNSISINVDMLGVWRKQSDSTGYYYDIGGRQGDLIIISLLSSGDFKINY